MVFWLMMPCDDDVVYQHFQGPCCCHLWQYPTTTWHGV